MANLLTIRLDAGTRKRIDRIARRKKLSTSAAVRQVLVAWVDQEEPGPSLYEQMKDFIGVVNGGDPKRSADIGRKFAKMLQSRRRSS